ncbi:MAG: DUF4329 domain-containing protein [Pseudomonadota bacterium]
MVDFRSNRFILTVCAILWVVIALRVMTRNADIEREYIPPVASQDAIQSFAKMQLDRLQTRSFSEGVEYCGFIWEDEEGNLDTSDVFRGNEARCGYEFQWPLGVKPVAGYHTHGTYDPRFDDEVPSITDLQSDIESRIDGYVSTPGGRLWRIDWDEEVAFQICGEQCVTQDPTYQPCEGYLPQQSYTLSSLQDRIENDPGRC